MACCEICGKEIERGKRYKSPKYKQVPFCSEDCYNQYVFIKNQNEQHRTDLRKSEEGKEEYKKYIHTLAYIYPKEKQNWVSLQRQTAKLIDDYGLNYKLMRNIIVYAIKYDDCEFNPNYGLGQIFPAYISKFNKFKQDMEESMSMAQEMENEEYVVVIKPKSNKRFEVRNESFD